MAKGKDSTGMQTFEQHIDELFKKELISQETAKASSGEEPTGKKTR
jgi:Tfp pilus assembly pilus retraction ATPase PilT